MKHSEYHVLEAQIRERIAELQASWRTRGRKPRP